MAREWSLSAMSRRILRGAMLPEARRLGCDGVEPIADTDRHSSSTGPAGLSSVLSLAFDQNWRERGLGVLGELGLVRAAEGVPLDLHVQGSVRPDPGGFGVEPLLGPVAEQKRDALRLDSEGADEVRRVLDREVGPVVAVREDVPAVVRMAADPGVKCCCQAQVIDGSTVVPESPRGIQPDGALPRASLGGRE